MAMLNFPFSPFENPNIFLFKILGLKIFLDDALILCLLFFLYQEHVKDDGLFLILILLLFT